VLGGTLFHLFLGEERKVDRLVVSLGGAVILASGTAAYLNVSPLLATLVIGIVLVNTSRGRAELRTVLAGRNVRSITCCCCWPGSRGVRRRRGR
jgi:hypothetical protein